MVTIVIYWKEGRLWIKVLNGRSSLKWDVKSKHHRWMLRHFSQVLGSLGEFGTSGCPLFHDTEWRY